VRITPQNSIGHRDLEAEVAGVFEAHDFLTAKAPYHDTMAPEIIDRLSQCNSPTARYLRGRSDRVAIHRRRDQVIPWEVKTTPGLHPRIPVEAIPIMHHVQARIPVLYVCRHLRHQWDAAFWTHRLPKFDVIFISPKCDAYESGVVQRFFGAPEFWKWKPTFEPCQVNGSGDAFALISRESLEAVGLDWRAEIARRAAMDELDDFDRLSSEPERCLICGDFVPARMPHRCFNVGVWHAEGGDL